MKLKIYCLLTFLVLVTSVSAQAPQKMSYQVVIRNSSNVLITSTVVGMKISILQGTATGTPVYVETQTPTTNANGLATFEIGTGTAITGTFATINWAAGPYFVKTETDPNGGSAYTIVGTNQLMSVPYALYSANGSTGVSGFSHYLGEPYLGGIIFYLYKGSDGLEHGLVVSLTQSGFIQWQTTPTLVNANRSWDGVYNTALMSNSPAAAYISSLGSGWYLPSFDELCLLFYNRYEVNKGLSALGITVGFLLSSNYWSSTEDPTNFNNAYYFVYIDGTLWKASKTNSNRVRGIKAF